jgi:hypothetical protein
VTQAAVAAEVHQPLDVHRDFAAQVAFDLVVAVDRLADLQHFRVGQLVDAAVRRDADLVDDLLGKLLADAVNVLKRNDDALVGRNVDAGYTSWRANKSFLCFFKDRRRGTGYIKHDVLSQPENPISS